MRFDHNDDIFFLWKKVEEELLSRIISGLKKMKVIPETKILTIGLKPDFENYEDWRIETILKKEYTAGEEKILYEEITLIEGRLFVYSEARTARPSFEFEWNAETDKFKANREEIQRKVSKVIEDVDEQFILDTSELNGEAIGKSKLMNSIGKGYKLYDAKEENKLKAIREGTNVALSHFGFSEEEKNVMVLAALKHESFTPDMSPEQIVTLALQSRNTLLSKK